MPKKTTAKKAPKPKSDTIVPAVTIDTLPALMGPQKFSYDILAQPSDIMDNVKACMTAAKARCKNRPSNFKTLAEIRRTMIPVRDFYMRYALGSYGVPQASHIDIIGPPHIGKTSLLWWFIGGAMLMGAPCYVQESEGKPMTPGRAIRFIHTNPTLALNIAERVLVEQVFSLQHSVESMVDWVNSMRGRENTQKRSVNVPMSTPLIVAVDTWGKLMNPAEAAGRYNYADGMSAENKKKYNEVGEGSNMGHAKWAHAFGRMEPHFLAQNNVILVTIRHQDTKVEMGGGKGGFTMTAEQGALYNKTSIGGLSFNQNASVQLIMGPGGQVKDASGNVIGDLVKIRVDKQSYGPKGRIVSFILKNDGFSDRDDYIEQAIKFGPSMATWMATAKLCGVRADDKKFSCEALGVTAVDGNDLATAFYAHPEVEYELGKRLGIDGYIDFVDQIKQNLVRVEKEQADAEKAAKDAEAQAKKDATLAKKEAAATAKAEAALRKAPPKPPVRGKVEAETTTTLEDIKTKEEDGTITESTGVTDSSEPVEPVQV